MRKIYTLKKLLTLALLAVCVGLTAQTTVTYTFSEKGYTNAQDIASGELDSNLAFEASQGTGTNPPKYYTSGAAARFYPNNTFTITPKNGAVITSVKLVAVANYVSTPVYSVDGGAETGATLDGVTYSITGLNASNSFVLRNSATASNFRLATVEVTYTGGAAAGTVVATPTITPATGNYYEAQTVSIETATADATIHYTTDGTEPSTSSPVYTAPFAVSTTTTVKAIAVATGKTNSSVATVTLTFPGITAEAATIAELRGLSSGDSKTYKFTGEAVITVKSANRNAKYIQDATGAILIDDTKGVLANANYNVGDKLTGVVGYLTEYQGMLQFVPYLPGQVASAGNVVAPTVVAASDLGNYQAQLVTVKGLTFSDTGNFAKATYTATVNGESVAVRVQYDDLAVVGTAIPTGAVDVTGVVLTYATRTTITHQLVPVSIASATSGIAGVASVVANVTTADGKIFVEADGEVVTVYNVLGQVVSKTTAKGTARIAVPAGQAYIVKVGNSVAKVFVK